MNFGVVKLKLKERVERKFPSTLKKIISYLENLIELDPAASIVSAG